MRIYAIYRMYYGEDFIKASILSIYPFVNKIFVFASEKSFWDVCENRIDNSLSIVKNLQKEFPKITIIRNSHFYKHPRNQFTDLYNYYIYDLYEKPDCVMCIEPDMVWENGHLHSFLDQFNKSGSSAMNSDQVEFWHNDKWVLPPRERFACIIHRLKSDGKMINTGLSGDIGRGMPKSTAKVYNYGFCLSPENMKNKCELGLKYSYYIGDSIPNPFWYLAKWLKWHPEYNNENLEISKGYEGLIPCAVKSPLPRNIHLIDHKWNPSIFTQAQVQNFGDILTR